MLAGVEVVYITGARNLSIWSVAAARFFRNISMYPWTTALASDISSTDQTVQGATDRPGAFVPGEVACPLRHFYPGRGDPVGGHHG